MGHPRPSLPRQRGVVLIMLLMVLIGVGSMLLIAWFRPTTNDRVLEEKTLKRLTAAREALIGFATQHGRLPRPARSALDGREIENPCTSTASCSGFLPWITLGIEGADSWGRILRYSVTPSFTFAPIQAATVGGDKIVLTRDSQGILQYLVGREACPLYAKCSPVVLYSSGKNNFETSVSSKSMNNLNSTNIDEQENQKALNRFISRSRIDNSIAIGGEFDDLVAWIPVQQLYARMRAAHVLN